MNEKEFLKEIYNDIAIAVNAFLLDDNAAMASYRLGILVMKTNERLSFLGVEVPRIKDIVDANK